LLVVDARHDLHYLRAMAACGIVQDEIDIALAHTLIGNSITTR